MDGVAPRFLIAAAALAVACGRPDLLPETPRIEVSSLALSFQPQDGRFDPDAATVDVRAVGGPLEVTGVSTVYAGTSGWLSVDVADPASSPARLTVRPHIAGLAWGRHEATLYVNAPGMVNSPFPVKVSLDVPRPRMAVNARDVWFRMHDGELPPPYEVKVTNAGGGTLAPLWFTLDFLGAPAWLSVTLGSDPHTLVLQPDADRIADTFNFAVVTLRSTNAVATDVYVALAVDPELQLSTHLVRFRTEVGRAWPGPTFVTATPSIAASAFGRPTLQNRQSFQSPNFVACEGWLRADVEPGGPPFAVTLTPVPAVVASVPLGGCLSDVEVRSQLPNTNTLDVIQVELSVEPQVDLSAPLWQPSTSSLSFSGLTGGDDPPAQTFTVEDAVGVAAAEPVVTSDVAWLTATVFATPIGPAEPRWTVSVQPRTAGLAGGFHDGVLSVSGYPVHVVLQVEDWAGRLWLLNQPLFGHTATALGDGKVLLVGINTSLDPESAFEVLDGTQSALDLERSSRSWGLLHASRAGHTATALADGRVVAAGGVAPCCLGAVVCDCGFTVGTWEIFDPATSTWPISRPLATARFAHVATALADGTVLLAGGIAGTSDPAVLASAEILDPATGRSTPTGSLPVPIDNASAVRLEDGRVLVAGGATAFGVTSAAQIFDPAAGTWSRTGDMNDNRLQAALVPLANGRVLAAGGRGWTGPLASAEIYDPATGTWTRTGSMAIPRVAPAVRLPSGRVLMVAGATTADPASATNTVERYDPATRAWTPAASLRFARKGHAATLLSNGRVLVTGGTFASDSPVDAGVCCGLQEAEIGGIEP